MMLFVGMGPFSPTKSGRRAFTVKKYASVILFPNDLYFPLTIQEKWTKHWWLSRGWTELLANWKMGICQLCHLQFEKTFFPCFIKVSDMLVLFSSNNKTQLRSSRVVLKTNKYFLSRKSVLFTNCQKDMKEWCNSMDQFVAQNTQSTHRTETVWGLTVSRMIPNYKS